MNNKELNRFVRKLEKRAERKDEELKKLLKESVNDNFPWWCCCCATRAQKRKFISDFKKKNKNRYRLYLETAYKVKRQQDRARD